MERRTRVACLAVFAAVVVASGLPAHARAAGPSPVTVEGLLSTNATVDGPGTCLAGGPGTCTVFTAKQFVWLTGGPAKKSLSDGYYFFAVISPGGNPLDQPPSTFPKPRTDANLSDDFDPYTNRTFQVVNGEIKSYAGTHTFAVDTSDNNEKKIRVFPYSDSVVNGIYQVAVCPLGTDLTGLTYPVDPAQCTYDAFVVASTVDATPPSCTATLTKNGSGQQVITITVQDPESGVESIVPASSNVTTVLPSWSAGATTPLVVTGTQVDPSTGASLSVVVTNVSGQSATCGGDAPPVSPEDATPPVCVLTASIAGPPKSIQVTVQDAESGITSITHTEANAAVGYSLTPGTTSPVVVTGTKIDQGVGSFLQLRVTNGAGGVTVCDPLVPAAKRPHAAGPDAGHVPRAAHGLTLAVDSSSVLFGEGAGVTLRGAIASRQAGQTVTILGQAAGFTEPSVIAVLKTGAGGVFRFRVQPQLNTTFTARWKTARSEQVHVAVKPLISVRRTSAGRYRVTLRTTNGVFLAGRQVLLQRASGGRWTTIARATLTRASGVTQLTVVSAATFRGVHAHGAKLRVVLLRNAYYAGARSRVFSG